MRSRPKGRKLRQGSIEDHIELASLVAIFLVSLRAVSGI
jgi:hypothetical protein